MKPFILVLAICCLLFTVFLQPLTAQEQKEGGAAVCYDEAGDDILFASHSTYPFGTRLIVTNPVYKSSITVQVGGRPNPTVGALIELSPQAAEKLNMPAGWPTWVFVEPVPEAQIPRKHVMRAQIGAFKQKGIASVQKTGSGLTAAHASLPLGSMVKVTSLNNGKAITLTINSRIPASADRVIEVSPASAYELEINGRAAVLIESVNN